MLGEKKRCATISISVKLHCARSTCLQYIKAIFYIKQGWSSHEEVLQLWAGCQYLEAGWLFSSSWYFLWRFPGQGTPSPVDRWSRWTEEGRCWLPGRKTEGWVLRDTKQKKPNYCPSCRSSWPKGEEMGNIKRNKFEAATLLCFL